MKGNVVFFTEFLVDGLFSEGRAGILIGCCFGYIAVLILFGFACEFAYDKCCWLKTVGISVFIPFVSVCSSVDSCA